MQSAQNFVRSTLESTETIIKNRVGDLEYTLDRGVDKLTGLIYDDDRPHQVSDFPWRGSMFKFRATLHHGVPGSPSAIAFDSVQNLLAMGTSRGLVKIFGKPGVEVVVNQYDGVISHLEFIENSGKLVIVYKTFCAAVNLETRRPIGSYDFKSEVCCVRQLSHTPYVWVGLSTGNVHILHVGNKVGACGYYISARNHLDLGQNSPVVALEMHPIQPTVLLIAHEDGNLVEWGIDTERVLRTYQVPDSSGSLNTAVWHPQGTKIAAGFKNGDVIVWRRNESTPQKTYKMTFHPNTPRRPIKRLYWTKHGGASYLCTFGGASISHEAFVNVSIRYKKTLALIPPVGVKNKNPSQSETPSPLIDILLALEGRSTSVSKPLSLVGISANADIFVYTPLRGGKLHPVTPPPNFRFQLSPITATLFSNIPKVFLSDLVRYGNSNWSSRDWILKGGVSSLQPQTSTDILLTGHSDGNVFFWDMSNTHFNLIYSLTIRLDSSPKSPSIESIDLCVDSRTLAVSCTSGETFVYCFSDIATRLSSGQAKEYTSRLHQLRTESRLLDIVPQKLPTSNSNPSRTAHATHVAPTSSDFGSATTSFLLAKPPTVIESRSSPQSSERREKHSHSSTSRKSSEKRSREKSEPTVVQSATTTVFSWEKFFLNANVDPKSAAEYGAHFESQKMTDDLVPDIDEGDMNRAGITTVGDQKRVMRYIKSGYVRENCLVVTSGGGSSRTVSEGQSSRSRRSGKESSSSKSKSKRTTSSRKKNHGNGSPTGYDQEVDDLKRLEKLVEKDFDSTLEEFRFPRVPDRPSSNVVSMLSAPSSMIDSLPVDEPDEPEESLHTPPFTELPPGFQLKVQIPFRNKITQIRVASSLSKIAVGDYQGNVALLDINTGTVLLHKSLGENQESPVTWLCFDDRAMVQKTVQSKRSSNKTRTMLEPGLFVGLRDGRIFYIALKTGQVDRITFDTDDRRLSSLSSILLLDGTGAAVLPGAEIWKSSNELQQELSSDTQDSEEEPEFVIRNLDEELSSSKNSKKKEGKLQGPIAPENKKYILVCSGKRISIYALPSYKLYSEHECDHRPESANVVEFEGNWCLVVFLSSGDMQVLSLMDLQVIKTELQALQKIGVIFNPKRLSHDVNCSRDGRFVVISKFQEVIRGSLFEAENLLGLPYSLPRLHGDQDLPPSVEQAIFPFLNTDYSNFFGMIKYQAEQQPQQQQQQQQPKARGVASAQAGGNSARASLMAGATGPKMTAQQQAMKQNPAMSFGEKLVKSVGSSVNDVQEIMSQNFNALALRKEKLDELLVSSEQLAQRSSAFASVASDLAEKESSRKWWR